MSNIKDKILTLVKLENPNDPMQYVQDVVKDYTLEKVKSELIACDKCELCTYKTKSIPRGNSNSKVLIIGESVSQEQFDKGGAITMPFVDEDGDTLSRALKVIQANESELFMVNAVSCFTGKNDGSKIIKRIPSVDERTSCKKYLDKIIKAINPNVIVTLGSVAANALSENRISILTDRGNPFYYNEYYVMPTFHPSFFREMAAKFDEEMMNMYKDSFLVDLYTAFLIEKEKNENSGIGDIKLPF